MKKRYAALLLTPPTKGIAPRCRRPSHPVASPDVPDAVPSLLARGRVEPQAHQIRVEPPERLGADGIKVELDLALAPLVAQGVPHDVEGALEGRAVEAAEGGVGTRCCSEAEHEEGPGTLPSTTKTPFWWWFLRAERTEEAEIIFFSFEFVVPERLLGFFYLVPFDEGRSN